MATRAKFSLLRDYRREKLKEGQEMKTYKDRKEEARRAAIAYQAEASAAAYSLGELAEIQAYFEKIARRFGLVREFRENAII